MVVCVVDGNSLWARSFFAAQGDPVMATPKGAAELAIKSLLATISPLSDRLRHHVTHLAICWDGAAKRDKQRAPKPAEYGIGKQIVIDVLAETLGCAMAYPETEADDAVATIAAKSAANPDVEHVYVVSGDKDLQQLIDSKVSYFSLNDKCILTWLSVLEKWHVKHPCQIAVALAILGDPGDRIQGIKGWGRAKLAKIFEPVAENEDLVDVYAKVTATMKPEQLAVFDECLDLTLLRRDLPGMPDPAEIVVGPMAALEVYGLNHLKSRFMALSPGAEMAGVDEI